MRDPRWAHALAITAAALLLPLTAAADVVTRLRLAEAASLERLRLRVQAAALADGAMPGWWVGRMRRDMERQGYYADGGSAEIVVSDLMLVPALSWDGNINGGVLQDRFVSNGLIFEAAPEARAVGAVVAGVQGFARTSVALDNGRLIELRGSLDLGYSPATDLGRVDAQLGICSQNHITGWTFLDLCASRSYYWRDLVKGDASTVSVASSQIFVTGASAHQVAVRIMRVSGGTTQQDRIAFSANSVWRRIATRGELTLGEEVLGQTSLDYRIEGGISWLMMDRTFGVDLSRQVLGDGAFLGVQRRDVVHGATFSAELRPGLELRLGLVDSRSTAEIADYRQANFDLRLSSFR